MLRVLIYHRVSDPSETIDLNPRMISATPAMFEQQMKHLARHYRVVSMEEVLEAITRKKNLPGRSVLITFDDAYYDFKSIAWPIMRNLDLPVTLFVPTGFPGHPERWFWWDRIYRAFVLSGRDSFSQEPLGSLNLGNFAERMESMKKLQNHIKGISHHQAMDLVQEICERLNSVPPVRKTVLDWHELRELAAQGVTLGAHTRTHPIMTRLSPAEVAAEVEGSYADLQREIGEVLPIFCYPAGGHDDAVVDILRAQNIKAAFTTRKGQNDLRQADPLRLRRQNITRRTTMPIFAVRLMRWASHLDAWRHRNQYMPKAVAEAESSLSKAN